MFQETVERIAKAWAEQPCPDPDFPGFTWDEVCEDDKEFFRRFVSFVLTEQELISIARA